MTVRIRRRLRSLAAVFALGGAGCTGSDSVDNVTVGEDGSRIEYGDHSDAFGDLWLPTPSPDTATTPVVVLVHGGFWRDGFFLDLMDPLVPSLLERGYAVWNIEYRRVGAGGGYPATFEDVASAVDHLAELPDSSAPSLDLDRVAMVGHSAGGHLAAWAAGRSALSAGAIGADPRVRPVLAVSQAGVLDLSLCVERNIGGTACVDLMGAGPVDEPERFAVTSPSEMVPFDAVVVAVHGELDRIVPADQSVTFVERAVDSGMTAEHRSIPGGDHFSNLDPGHAAWIAVLDALDEHL